MKFIIGFFNIYTKIKNNETYRDIKTIYIRKSHKH